MKRLVIFIITFIAFIILISESEIINFTYILLKVISLFWLWIISKISNRKEIIE